MQNRSVEHEEQSEGERVLQTFFDGKSGENNGTFGQRAEDEPVVHSKAVSLVNECTCCEPEMMQSDNQDNRRSMSWHKP
ncbi:hypothetical protein KSD_01560 [Ktedonobacter sp. SOSP1-85]|nr:hypothetical protein KSD_01560 [Ktedonobacter sp. SOSP1-85]